MRSARLVVVGTVLWAVLCWVGRGAARADIVVLAQGGRVVGELVDNPAAPQDTITVRTAAGGQVTLAKAQVQEVLRQRPGEMEYEAIRSRYADSVEGQWALAEWCRQRNLTAQRQHHLRRVIDLDPNHQKARWALGYTQINGQWTTKEEVMTKQGMKLYKGRWRLPQEIELMEERHRTEVLEKEWKQKLNRWRDWLATDKAAMGRQNILQTRDPMAVKALAAALKDDPQPAARLLYVEALGHIGNHEAKGHLAICSVEDPVEEVRMSCLDYLKKDKAPHVINYYISKLRSRENHEVNLAAIGLREMGDRSAIGPLIDALVTTHKRKISSGNPGQMSMSFGSQGPAGMSAGGGPKVIVYPVQNRAVLDALVALAEGPNFAFDVPQWKTWYAAQKKSQSFDPRRD